MSLSKELTAGKNEGVCLRTCPCCGGYTCCSWSVGDRERCLWNCSRCGSDYMTYNLAVES